MSTIRKQSIISSVVIYIGFAVGLLNTYFLTKQGLFFEEEYGLVGIFTALSSLMMALASMAMPAYIFKFFPYYHDHLTKKKNDMISWALLIGVIGFILVTIGGVALKHLIVRKFSENSNLLVRYYYWTFILGFGFTVYSILEAYTWNLGKSVFTNYLKEVQWRLFTTILIVLFIYGIIPDFDLFIKLYSFTHPGIAVILLLYLILTKKIHFTLSISKVSRRFFSKIFGLCIYAYSAMFIFTLSQVFDSIVIAAVLPDGLSKAGIFALAQVMISVIQVPQRAIIATSIGHLSRAWKEKNMALIQRIYQRSSLNMLIFAAAIFLLIALNYREAIVTFGLKDRYLLGFNAFVVMGLTRIIDMGTGVNAQIIATSTYWKFELVSGIILLILILPLTIILTRQYDILGPAIAGMISTSVYNAIRIIFLWYKFRLFPFSLQSLYALLLAAACFLISYFLFLNMHKLPGLILRSLVFAALYGAGVIYFRLSPDVKPVWETVLKRLKWRKY